ncbi:hypothetical protein FAZ69_29135 [Trinickia terrae]|uniref:Lipoprotein n=1 Tax=Trinickia terrae TaxID=2571161 RepID=A0A4U1HH68_9BURK|nr:hypothetical protein [Trinickia terrae]TKC80381.1 hypothetical protein FAZ69_29135 [Trinickia terrae]
MRIYTALSITLLLCSCTSVSPIQRDARERYSVTARTSNPIVSWRHLMNVSIGHAAEFCEQEDKAMHQVDIGTFGVRGFSPREADLRFECVPRWQQQ